MKTSHKWGLAATAVIAVLATVVFLAYSRFQKFLYPPAPRMPAVVNASMPEILHRLELVLQTNAPQILPTLQPGLSDAEIARLEQQHGVRLPDDLKALYHWHDGAINSTNQTALEFLPIHRFVPLAEALADRNQSKAQGPVVRGLIGYRDSWIPLLADGAGDGYWYDPKRTEAQGAVFFNFTETASYVFFPSVKNLFAGITEAYARGIIHLKPGATPPELDEDFEKAEKLWNEFGTSNYQ